MNENIYFTDKVGVVCTFIIGFQLVRFFGRILYNLIAPALKINAVNIEETGKWAVVTGATDGIGKAYAQLLAKKGLNIVLISRTQSKLEDVAKEIEKDYNIETKIIAADFTNTSQIYYDIDKQLTGLDIGVLINNVGMSNAYPEYFLDLKNASDFYKNMINCNIFSVTNMCQIVMPGMVERRRGVVVNIASTAAQVPSPLLTVYSASKAFVDKFSTNLAAEYCKYGITVQSLLPGYVATNMSRIRKETWMAPFPLRYVEEALKTIGVKERTTGYFAHSLMAGFIHALECLSPKLSRWVVIRTMTNIRARALRKPRR